MLLGTLHLPGKEAVARAAAMGYPTHSTPTIYYPSNWEIPIITTTTGFGNWKTVLHYVLLVTAGCIGRAIISLEPSPRRHYFSIPTAQHLKSIGVGLRTRKTGFTVLNKWPGNRISTAAN